MVVRLFEAVKAFGDRRTIEIAHVAIGDRDLIKENILRPGEPNAFSHDVAIVVVARDFCVYALVEIQPAVLKLQSSNRFRAEVELLQIEICPEHSGSPTRTVPAGGETVAGKQSVLDAVLAGRVKMESAFHHRLVLALVAGRCSRGVFYKVVARAERKGSQADPARKFAGLFGGMLHEMNVSRSHLNDHSGHGIRNGAGR